MVDRVFSKPFSGLLGIMGFYGSESLRTRQALNLFAKCEDQAVNSGYFEFLHLPDTFTTKHNLIAIHIWMVHKRLIQKEEGDKGKLIQEKMFDIFWEDTQRRIRETGVNELTVNKHTRNVQRMTFGALIQHDHGLKQTNDNNLELSSSLWRTLYSGKEDPPKDSINAMAEYMREEVHRFQTKYSQDDIFNSNFEWNLPNGMIKKPEMVDANGDTWKRSLAVTGREYFWNTRTRESRWEKPDLQPLKETNEKTLKN